MKINGTWKTIAVILSIVVAAGGIVWSVAVRSDNLDDVIKEVAEHKKKYDEVEVRVNTVEKAIIKIETNQGHMMGMQEKILYELRK